MIAKIKEKYEELEVTGKECFEEINEVIRRTKSSDAAERLFPVVLEGWKGHPSRTVNLRIKMKLGMSVLLLFSSLSLYPPTPLPLFPPPIGLSRGLSPCLCLPVVLYHFNRI